MESFVARQPIFTKDEDVFAYELLFRTGLENAFPDFDGDAATSNVIMDSFVIKSVDGLTKGKRAFINFSENLLLNDFAFHLPAKEVVIEILEDIPANEQTISACQRLREAGYTLALDDFVLDEANAALMDHCDIIKVDYMLTTPETRRQIVERVAGRPIKLLAEKVETREEYQQAIDEGFEYFQGYFFAKPEIVQGKRMPESKLSKLELIKVVSKENVNFNEVNEVIKRDASLTYKLLRYINSAAFGFSHQIESVQQAVVYLGIAQMKKWVALVAMADLGADKPAELLVKTAMRARFCERLAEASNKSNKSDNLFLVGMFSHVDAILDRPMEKVLNDVPLHSDVKSTLLGKPSECSPLFQIVQAYEAGNFARVQGLCKVFKIDHELVPEIYQESLNWASELIAAVKGAGAGTKVA